MFSFEREELGDEFERPMDTKGGRMMVALPILVSLRPKEKRMTKQICLVGQSNRWASPEHGAEQQEPCETVSSTRKRVRAL
jgi:hypothetical protein